jgi:predicted component of type VI protein secretion system
MNEDGAPSTERPHFSFREAADICAVSKITIRRAHDAGKFANEWRAAGFKGPASGEWRVPIEDLLAAGFKPHAANSSPQAPRGPQAATAAPPLSPPPAVAVDVLEPHSRIAELERELADERHRRELAEAIAAEQRAHLVDLRQALLILNPGPPPVKRRWWTRRS